jgi:hypothetical protein
MKFKKSGGISSTKRTPKTKDDKVVISPEYYTNEIKPSYLCSFCNQKLVRLSDAGGNNNSFWCRQCSVEWDPESENLRKESKLVVPGNSEPAVTSIQTNMADEVEIRHTVPKRGGFAELEKKGIKIKGYHTTEKE